MLPELAQEFTYQIGWRSRGRRPGRHMSAQRGLGMDFIGHAPLVSYPDPRRIDLRQTIRDPFDQVFVRIFNQRSSTPVFVACDLSGSMGFSGHHRKMLVAAQITASAAYSASRISDPFGFIGFDDEIPHEWTLRGSTRMQAAYELAVRLKDYTPEHKNSDGILEVSQHLGRERGLVFLISDFHMPIEILEEALISMQRHHVVPIVLWDSSEYQDLPEFGIAQMADSESGQRRSLFLRGDMRARIQSAFAMRKEALYQLFMRYDTPPLFMEEGFNADMLTEYFYQFMAA